MNIAIIDDVQEEIKKLTDTLGQQLSALDHMEYQLHTYHSGEEFLSDWTSNNFDLIILDIFSVTVHRQSCFSQIVSQCCLL